MKIVEMSAENRPRERLERHGPEALSNAELLALILKSGTKKENVLEICQKLLSKYPLEKLASCTAAQLTSEHGIGRAKAYQIMAIFELYTRTNSIKIQKVIIRCAQDIAKLYIPALKKLQNEQFIAIYLDTKNRIICDQVISMGILNASILHPREVFHGAIKNLAHSLIVVHNHPSGDPTPSEEDIQITKRLHKTGEIMGILLLDHIIIGNEIWWSWKESR